MVENKAPLERLYLGKGDSADGTIYVDTVRLPQHQYDGIRFLYRQYKKGKPGVVLNDPSGYGKKVQTLLFLSAIKPNMTTPTLILCSEGKERIWKHEFNKWTRLGHDVSIHHGNDYVKSLFLIGNFTQINYLSRCNWSVVVVDDSYILREVLRSEFSTNYKIWISAIDMKKNLQTFSLIYKWFHPRERFNIEDFQPNKKTPSIILTKSTKLDAFMENIVIRRRDVKVPLGKSNSIVDAQTVSRKNKDATGKKIKRSKPLPAYDHDTSGESEEMGPHENITEVTENGKVGGRNENTKEFVVNFENESNTNMIDNINDLFPSDSTSDKDIKKDSYNKSEDEIVLLKEPNKMNIELDTAAKEVPKIDLVTEPILQDASLPLLNSGTILSENFILKYDSDTPDIYDEVKDDIPTKKPKIPTEIDTSTNKINQVSASEDLFTMDTNASASKSENLINSHDDKSSSDTKTDGTDLNCEKVLHTITDSTTNELDIETKHNDLNCIENEVGNETTDVSKNETGPKLEGVELKMKQMEELAMKKFKGSFLDSMF